MTDQLLSATSDEPPTALQPNTPADGGGAIYSDQSETEAEKPVILELGTTPNPHPHSHPAGAYVSVYPLDMHLNTSNATYLAQDGPIYSPSMEHQHHHQHHQTIASIAPHHLSLYNNPYTHHPLPTSTTITPMIPPATTAAAYPSHIPQTVFDCAWSTPEAPPDGRSPTPELVVPPPMYISYVGAREHIIAKDTNPSWKEKAMQIEKDYKKTACDRERTRMRDMNRAFDLLRSKLPISKPNGKKYSKIESLRIAINYINHLQQCLREGPPDLDLSALSSASQPNAVDYVMEIEARRRQQFSSLADKELDDSHSGAWSDNSYIPNGQDHWD